MLDDQTFWDEMEEFGETDSPELPPEPHIEDVINKTRKFRAEMYLNQEELAYKRLEDLEATEAERIAVVLAARAVITYRRDGTVLVTADSIISEVCPNSIARQIKLLNVVVPMARYLSARDATT